MITLRNASNDEFLATVKMAVNAPIYKQILKLVNDNRGKYAPDYGPAKEYLLKRGMNYDSALFKSVIDEMKKQK